MDRAFLSYYENELTHLRDLSGEFAALHPGVARNLSLDSVPCPDPYVERLLEGVAFLAARTRLKVDAESSRFVRNLLDALYPDLVAPSPAMSMARLPPGPQVDAMLSGYRVPRGTKLVSGLREGMTTRATYTTAQEVHLWPIQVARADYVQDPGALRAAGLGGVVGRGAEAGLRITLAASGPTPLADLALDRLDFHLGGKGRGGPLFDAIHGWGRAVFARPGGVPGFAALPSPAMVGLQDAEALLPPVRASFQGYRLLREYFLMPERFHYVRLSGLQPVLAKGGDGTIEIVIVLDRAQPDLAGIEAGDFQLFVTPLVNLFERECNIVEVDPRNAAHVVHADRTRPRDFEIFRLLRVEDAERTGREARILPLYGVDQNRGSGHVYATERRRRRPGEDELRHGQTRTSYPGDDLFISLARPPEARAAPVIRRLDIRALCTNRDLPILDDTPVLTLDTGAPVAEVALLGPFRRPRDALAAVLPQAGAGEMRRDELAWRWIGQLTLNHLSLAEDGKDAETLRALLDLYADRGDPALARHARSVTRVRAAPVIERLGIAGPICFGHGTEITLEIDEGTLSGGSTLLLSALLAQLFRRHASVNSFVRTRSRLMQAQEEVAWPMTHGTRGPI